MVKELAEFISNNESGIKCFSDKNLWGMKQFYEADRDSPKLSPPVREKLAGQITSLF